MITTKNGKLHLCGRVDSTNAAQLEQELFVVWQGGDAVIDAEKLEYISSAGLRVLMKLRKQTSNVTLENVSSEVYDIFEVTGFTELLTVKKALRFVSIEGCKVLGQGGHGKVYKLSDDMIIKTFHDGSSLEKIDLERQYGKNAFVNGIPCAIAFDVVRCEDGYGLVYEMAGAQSLSKYLMEHPQKVPTLGVQYGQLLKTLNSTSADPSLYGNIKEIYHQRIDASAELYTAEEVEQLHRMVSAIPEGSTMIHGDYHPGNVMVTDQEDLLLIDMADISMGHPVFDLGGTFMSMAMNPHAEHTIGVTPEIGKQLWSILLTTYYGEMHPQKLEMLRKCFGLFGLLRMSVSLNTETGRKLAPGVVALLRDKLFPNTESVIQLFHAVL